MHAGQQVHKTRREIREKSQNTLGKPVKGRDGHYFADNMVKYCPLYNAIVN